MNPTNRCAHASAACVSRRTDRRAMTDAQPPSVLSCDELQAKYKGVPLVDVFEVTPGLRFKDKYNTWYVVKRITKIKSGLAVRFAKEDDSLGYDRVIFNADAALRNFPDIINHFTHPEKEKDQPSIMSQMKVISEAQFLDMCLTLENDYQFVMKYQSAGSATTREARDFIKEALIRLGYLPGIYSRQQIREDLRRYFDDRWGVLNRKVGCGDILAECFPNYYEGCSYGATPPSPTTQANMATIQEPETMVTANIANTPAPAVLKIVTKTFANGQDIASMSAGSIYEMIAEQEEKIEALSSIKNKPKMLEAELAERQAGIDALVAHLDSRTAA